MNQTRVNPPPLLLREDNKKERKQDDMVTEKGAVPALVSAQPQYTSNV
jgi:hypothetical protein